MTMRLLLLLALFLIPTAARAEWDVDAERRVLESQLGFRIPEHSIIQANIPGSSSAWAYTWMLRDAFHAEYHMVLGNEIPANYRTRVYAHEVAHILIDDARWTQSEVLPDEFSRCYGSHWTVAWEREWGNCDLADRLVNGLRQKRGDKRVPEKREPVVLPEKIKLRGRVRVV